MITFLFKTCLLFSLIFGSVLFEAVGIEKELSTEVFNKAQLQGLSNQGQIREHISTQARGKTIINLIGSTGSGKGTQAAYLKAKTGLPHISIGELFRAETRNKTLLNDLIDIYYVKYPHFGDLDLPEEIWFGILLKRLSQPDCAKGYILDNFPRTAAQTKIFLQGILRPEDYHIPIYMVLSEDVIRERLKNRCMCPKCGTQVRGQDGDPSNVCKNPSCNRQKLHYRETDRDRVKMDKRFAVFKENIEPILHTLEERDTVNYIKLNGTEDPLAVAKIIDGIIFEKLVVSSNKLVKEKN